MRIESNSMLSGLTKLQMCGTSPKESPRNAILLKPTEGRLYAFKAEIPDSDITYDSKERVKASA